MTRCPKHTDSSYGTAWACPDCGDGPTVPYFLRLRDSRQVLCRITGFDRPQWWSGTEPTSAGERIARLPFETREQAEAMAREMIAREPDVYDAKSFRVCRIHPAIGERIEDVG